MNLPVGIAQGDLCSTSTTVSRPAPRQQRRRGPGRLLRSFLAGCFLRKARHGQTLPLTLHQQLERPNSPKVQIKRRQGTSKKLLCQGGATVLAAEARSSPGACSSCRSRTNTPQVSASSSSSSFPESSSTTGSDSGNSPEPSSSSSSIRCHHEQQLSGRRHTWLWTLRRAAGRLLHRLGRAISPKGPGDNDASRLERVLNVLTCIPFFIVGESFLRRPPGAHFVQFGQAMRLVGVIASLYHGSSGTPRVVLRKLDYWSIACASAILRRAVVGPLPQPLLLGMSVLVPLKPTLVTTANLAAVEARCLAGVVSAGSMKLLKGWAQHAAISLAAIVSFGLEKKLSTSALGPFVHGSWHCLAAGGMLTTGLLLQAACPQLQV